MRTLPKLLLIEENRAISEALGQALSTCYEVVVAGTAEQGLFRSDMEHYGAIILDLTLPDRSGLAVCEALRDRGVTAPILIISSETNVLTKIKLLDAGADDYLTKPFSLGELKARLRVVQRRSVELPVTTATELTVGELTLDRAKHCVSRDGQVIDLRRKEFAILECLMLRAGTVVNRDTLTSYGWEGNDDNWTNTIDVHIKYLRDKIDRPFAEQLIKTVHGVGYRLETTPAVIGNQKPAVVPMAIAS